MNAAPHEGADARKWCGKIVQRAPVIAGSNPMTGFNGGMTMGLTSGFGLHDNLWDLVQGGLPPLAVLQAATLNPAEYFHATDSMGTVVSGKLADFVFLDANPLQDIYNTRLQHAADSAVVANGRFYDRSDLDALLYEAHQRAARYPGPSTEP